MRSSKIKLMFVLPIGLALVSGCAEKKAPIPPFDATVVQRFTDGMGMKDEKSLSMMFTEDAKLMPPEKPFIEGRAAIQNYLQELFAGQSTPTELNQLDQIDMGEYVYREGTLVQHSLDGSTQYGKFSQLWKYSDGAWREHRVMWNISIPTYQTPAAAPAAPEKAAKPVKAAKTAK